MNEKMSKSSAITTGRSMRTKILSVLFGRGVWVPHSTSPCIVVGEGQILSIKNTRVEHIPGISIKIRPAEEPLDA